MEIDGKKIGRNNPVYIIAEGGVAHFGSLSKAKELVDIAVTAGADAFKLQAFQTDHLIANSLPDWKRRMKSREVGFDFIKDISEYCALRGITFLCTPHEPSVLTWLEKLRIPAYKVGSGERGNHDFLREIAKLKKPMILSTGTHREEDIRSSLDAVNSMGKLDIALLHCVTAYPVPFEQANLRIISRYLDLFENPIGYSDHTEGSTACLLAVAIGACIIEKHIAVDFDVPDAQDWRVSCGPRTFKEFVGRIRKAEKLMGSGEIERNICEDAALGWAIKSIVASKDLPAGHVIRDSDMLAKRAGGLGLPPNRRDILLGRKLKLLKKKDETIEVSDLYG